MRRPLKPDDLRIWSKVAATVHPLPGRVAPSAPPGDEVGALPPRPATVPPPRPASHKPAAPPRPVDAIEPRRHHRIVRDPDAIGARVDLHGLDQDRARTRLESFIHTAWLEGFRAVLVITGKGARGDGTLRRHTPEWLAAAHLRHIVAGVSPAHRRHGGEGALYVALKRRPRSLS